MSQISFLGRMFTCDIDGTLLIPTSSDLKSLPDRKYNMASFKATEDAIQKAKFDSVVLNTGRNYSEIKEIKDILKETTMPIDAILLQDGKRILERPKNLSPREWMAQLFNKDINYLKFENSDWAKNNKKPLEIIGKYLTEEKGFILRKNNDETIVYSKPRKKIDETSQFSRWEVSIVPPGIQLRVNIKGNTEYKKEELKNFAADLNKDIKKLLDKNGYKTQLDAKEELTIVSDFERSDINKGTAADYVKSKMDDNTDEVRAGDNSNDIEMLTDDNILAIQVGNDKTLAKALEGKDNVIQVPRGALSDGVIECAKRLDLVA